LLGHTANKRTAPEYAGAVCDLRRIYKNSRGLAASAQPMARPMCAPPKIQCHHSKVAGVSFSSPSLHGKREGISMSDSQGTSKPQHKEKPDWGFVAFLITIFVIAVALTLTQIYLQNPK
jgi:hypothetical protein